MGTNDEILRTELLSDSDRRERYLLSSLLLALGPAVGRVQAVTIQNTPRPIDVSAMNSPAA